MTPAVRGCSKSVSFFLSEGFFEKRKLDWLNTGLYSHRYQQIGLSMSEQLTFVPLSLSLLCIFKPIGMFAQDPQVVQSIAMLKCSKAKHFGWRSGSTEAPVSCSIK